MMYSTRSSNTCTVRPFYTKKRKEKRLQVKIGEKLQYQNKSRRNLEGSYTVRVSKQYTLKPQAATVFIPRSGAITSLKPNKPQAVVFLVALRRIK